MAIIFTYFASGLERDDIGPATNFSGIIKIGTGF
jgi:hypothetical protein